MYVLLPLGMQLHSFVRLRDQQIHSVLRTANETLKKAILKSKNKPNQTWYSSSQSSFSLRGAVNVRFVMSVLKFQHKLILLSFYGNPQQPKDIRVGFPPLHARTSPLLLVLILIVLTDADRESLPPVSSDFTKVPTIILKYKKFSPPWCISSGKQSETNLFMGSSHDRSGTKYHLDTTIHKFSLFPTKLSESGQWGLFLLVSLSGGGPPGRHPPAGGNPTTGFLHKGEALQSWACLSQRQHSLSDLPSAVLYQASFALMNASHHDRCSWIDARVSQARATLGIFHKRKKYSGAHLRHCNSLRSCR